MFLVSMQEKLLGFLGPNGAGKSTTMKIICCYTASQSGDVFVNGISVKTILLALKKQLGYLAENNPLMKICT